MKTCISCQTTKEDHEFGKNRSLPDGLSVYCLACNRIKSRDYYKARRKARGLGFREPDTSPEGFKRCSECRQTLPHADFHAHRTQHDGLNTYCKSCRSARSRAVHLMRTYKLTQGDIDRMVEEQGGVCGICGEGLPEHVDHCHETGAVRGILCFNCNGGLGQFKDRVDILRKAITYLERTRDPS